MGASATRATAPLRHLPHLRVECTFFSFPVTPFFLGGDPPSPRTRQETEPWQPTPAHSEPLPSRPPHNPCPRPPNTRRYRAKLPHRSGRLWRQRYGWAVPEGANGGWGCGSSAGWGSRGLGWVPAAAPHVPVSPEADARTRRGTTTAPARRLGGGGACRGAQARRVSGTTRSGWQRRHARSILDRCPAKGLRPDLHSRSTTQSAAAPSQRPLLALSSSTRAAGGTTRAGWRHDNPQLRTHHLERHERGVPRPYESRRKLK